MNGQALVCRLAVSEIGSFETWGDPNMDVRLAVGPLPTALILRVDRGLTLSGCSDLGSSGELVGVW